MLTSEAAERLSIKKRSVARLIKQGLIVAEKRGRDYWIEPEEVERYARERKPAHRPRRNQVTYSVVIIHNTTCPDCKGEGSCAACEGSGIVVGVIGDQERAYTCGECDGDGFCSLCSGSGEIEDDDEDELPH